MLRRIWLSWLVFTIFTATTYFGLGKMSQTVKVELMIQPGFTTQWRVWRPFATDRTSFHMRTDKPLIEPLVLRIAVNEATCDYENDGSGSPQHGYYYYLVSKCSLTEKSGQNDWELTVLSSHPHSLQTLELVQSSPMGSLKFMPDENYKFFHVLTYLMWLWLPFWLLMTLGLLFGTVSHIRKNKKA